MLFLVSAAKRQRAEVKLTELTASERAEFPGCQGSRGVQLVENRHCPENVAKSISPRTSSQVQMDIDLETSRRIR